MKKITAMLCVFFMAIASNVYAEGTGSGNPKNDPLYHVKFDKTPRMIWKDGKLVTNPEYSNKAKTAKN